MISVNAKDTPPSTSEAFTIEKNEPYVRVYEGLASAFSPRSILELGIFQGGSYVLLDKLFNPRRMSAVEISGQPVTPLLQYIADKEGRFVHFSTSPSDRKILEHIVRNELADELDLVMDDAPTLMNKQGRPLRFFSHCCDSVASTQLRTGVGRTTLVTKHQMLPCPRATLCPTFCSNKSC